MSPAQKSPAIFSWYTPASPESGPGQALPAIAAAFLDKQSRYLRPEPGMKLSWVICPLRRPLPLLLDQGHPGEVSFAAEVLGSYARVKFSIVSG